MGIQFFDHCGANWIPLMFIQYSTQAGLEARTALARDRASAAWASCAPPQAARALLAKPASEFISSYTLCLNELRGSQTDSAPVGVCLKVSLAPTLGRANANCSSPVPQNSRESCLSSSCWSANMLEGSCHCGSARWQFHGVPASATACNCTACRRYGVLWAYGYEGENIWIEGHTTAYIRGDSLSFNFCPKCGGITHWRALAPNTEGRRRIAVNLRMTEPDPIFQVHIDHFDGLKTWEDLPSDGKCIKDMWF